MTRLAVKAMMMGCGVEGRTAIALAVSLQFAACASSFEPAQGRAPSLTIATSAPSGMSLVWRNTDLHPIRQPMAIGGVVIGVVAHDRKGFVVSIDPATGRTLWQQPLTHSGIARGVTLGVTRVGDDKVAYLRRLSEDGELAYLVVADARTGKELARSPEAWFASSPIVCANGKDVCAIAMRHFERRHQYRLDVSSGAFVMENNHLLRRTRFVDDSGLLDLGDRPGNTLGLLRNGSVRWLTRVSAAFPQDYTTDNGWSWRLYKEQHVYVGSLWAPRVKSGDYRVSDLASSATAGLSELTGKVLWRDTGSSFDCALIGDVYPVRCRMRGKLWYHSERRSSHVADLDVTVEGFDPATGKTTWSLPMGATAMLQGLDQYSAIAGPGQVVVQSANGPVVLDYATGTTNVPEPGTTFWCIGRASYELAPQYRVRTGLWRYTRTGGMLASICDERGYPATALPSIEATTAAGASVGSYVVIATSDGYLGFKTPEDGEHTRPGVASQTR